MNFKNSPVGGELLGSDEGKGTLGCLIFLLLLGAAIFATFQVGPTYYAYKNFESDIKTEASRAGAHFYENELVLNNIMALAKRNEIRLEKENVRVERFAGQLQITIHYSVPVDFIIYQRTLDFDINASSYIGRL